MNPCELLGNSARYLDALADTTPTGLLGTPFGVVSDALRAVAASVWDVDPTVYRAGIAWAWYLGARPSALAVDGYRALLCAALVSECAPLVRESQTVAELLALLTLWMDYRPAFADMEALFTTYGVLVDVRAISDPEGQALLPVDDTRLAFYVFVLSMDWARPMLLGEIAETARRASPLGARPFVVYLVEGFVSVPVAIAPIDGFLWVDVWESAVPVAPPGPVLPTVSYIGRFTYSGGGLSAGEIGTLRDSNNNTIAYNTGVSYAVYWYASSNWVYGDVSYVSLVNESGLLKVKNISSTYISIYFVSTYECSSNQATVVAVYDSSNEAYNAFMYTANGTDYYYVLDGTQTDWTDELSSIGYSLTKTPAVGDIITFGNYPQSTSTPEPIEWKVLEVDTTNRKAFLIAKKVLDCQKYNSTSASVTWETCSLRTWLNSTFFNAAFDSTEQGRIPLSHIETTGQSATDDNIFCMSYQDVNNTAYFADADARKALGAQKAIDAGAFTYNGYTVYWLRSAGSSSSRAMIISTVGGIDDIGYSVNDTSAGVRPALWMTY